MPENRTGKGDSGVCNQRESKRSQREKSIPLHTTSTCVPGPMLGTEGVWDEWETTSTLGTQGPKGEAGEGCGASEPAISMRQPSV